MKPLKTACFATLLIAAAGMAMNAVAGDKAFCEVRKSGEKAKKATGHCSFHDQGDRISIGLANGDSYTLSRKGDKKNQFKDQDGKPVHREAKKNGTFYFKWDHKNITVHPEGT